MATPERPSIPDAGRQLLRQVRAAFTAQGTSLHRWCLVAGVDETHVRRALLGERASPMAKRLRNRAIRAAGLSAKGAA